MIPSNEVTVSLSHQDFLNMVAESLSCVARVPYEHQLRVYQVVRETPPASSNDPDRWLIEYQVKEVDADPKDHE